jgi:replication factor C subunit 3/5
MALLKEIFGPGVEKIKLEHRTFKTTSNKTIEMTTIGSNFHIECNPSDTGNNDRFVVQEVIKEIASHTTLQSANSSRNFKVVILTEVDRLSKQAQASLRRTMERYIISTTHLCASSYNHILLYRYSSQCRLILICNSLSKIIAPVRSRCLGIRIPAPSHEEITELIMDISKKEQCPCPRELAVSISLNSGRNLRRAMLMLESCKVQHTPLMPTQQVLLPDWELYICRMAREIMQEQSPAKLLQVRDMLYELLTNCIPPEVIMTTLTKELMKSLDDQLKHELIYWSAFYEHRIQIGSKDIFHLEAFVAKFMSIYKKWIIAMFS